MIHIVMMLEDTVVIADRLEGDKPWKVKLFDSFHGSMAEMDMTDKEFACLQFLSTVNEDSTVERMMETAYEVLEPLWEGKDKNYPRPFP